MLHIHQVLIDLSNIFKQGFTVTYDKGFLNQYANTNKPFIVSYKSLITLNKDISRYDIIRYASDIPDKCLIGGWHDNRSNIYYIELNKAFKSLTTALKFAYKHKQEYVYNLSTRSLIKVKDWELKIKKWLKESPST